jgi:predicted HTH transcriptional regulator
VVENAESVAIRPHTRRLLDGQEGREVDFKQSPDGVDPEDLVAFANGTGGTILVGVGEVETESGLQRGRVIGCAISDELRVGFINKASSCRPPVELEVTIENLNDVPFYRIDIPEGSHKPYCTQKGVYKGLVLDIGEG